MRKYLLITVFFTLIGLIHCYGQTYVENCADVINPYTIMTDMDFAGALGTSNDGNYDANGITEDADIYAQIVGTAGSYDVEIDFSGLTGDISFSIGSDCSSLVEIYSGNGGADDFVIGCVQLTGSNQIMVISSESGTSGTYNINFTSNTTPPSNDECSGAIELFLGSTTGLNNNCSVDGRVWYSYEVVNGEDLEINITDATLTGTTLYNVVLNDCATGEDITLDYDCLIPGDIIYFEVGNDSPDFGTFDIEIVDQDNGVVNDVCSDASPLSMAISGAQILMSDADACPDSESTCASTPDLPGVWYEIQTGTGVNRLTFSSGEFEIYDGDCSSLNSLGCNLDEVCVTENTSYYVLVHEVSSIDVEAFGVTNDACADAIPLTDNTAETGTNACASPETNTPICAVDQATGHVVYYSYEYPLSETANADLTITVTGTGTTPITGASLGVWRGCGGTNYLDANATPSGNPQVSGDECDALGGPLEFECVEPGTTLIIAVASDNGSEGEFSITVTSDNTGAIADDVCTGAEVINITTDCTWQPESNDNTGSCPEFFTTTSCMTDSDQVVWQQVTLSSDATGLSFANITGGYVAVFSACGDAASGTPPTYAGADTDGNPISDCFTADTDILGLTGGETYYIATGISGGEGTINYDIKTITPPVNDACADAIPLTDNTAETGTNACASPETNIPICTVDQATGHVVYYSYEYPSSETANADLTITVTGTGTTPITGASLGVWRDCGGTNYLDANATPSGNPQVSGDECDALGGPLEFECVEPGTTLIIAVASDNGSEGEFSITVTSDNTGAIADDICTGAEVINITTDCTWQPESNDNTGSCPEFFTTTSCMTDSDQVVWQQVTLSSDATGLSFANITGGYVAVFSACGDAASGTPPTYAGADTDGNPISDCFTADTDILGLTGGETYYIATGISGGEGTINYDIKTLTPPVNDECADAIPLIEGSSESGTTECAGGPIVSTACDADKENTVWYSYEVMPDDKELTIDITNYTPTSGGAAQFSVAVFEACSMNPVFMNQADGSTADYCGPGETEEELTLSCLEAGTTFVIMVSSASANEATFDITINSTPIDAACIDNDDCSMIDDTSFPNPVVTNDPESCINDCNAGACPDEEINNLCGGTVNNAVFYQVTTDNFDPSIETFISATISGAGSEPIQDPIIMILSGTCGSYQLLSGSGCFTSGATGPLNDGWVDGSGNGLQPGTDYTIVVGTQNGDGGEFELCVTVSSGCANDEPCTSSTVDISSGSATVDSPASTVNCNNDFSNCGAAAQSTAWYQVEIPADMGNMLNVEITNVSINGDISVIAQQSADCNGVDFSETVLEECAASGTMMIECVLPGEIYFFQVGSNEDTDEGDFQITFTMDNQGPDNDKCSTPEQITPPAQDCAEDVDVLGTLIDACPWQADGGTCLYSENPTVFYEITIPAGDPLVTGINVTVTGLDQPMFAVLNQLDCDPAGGQAPGGGSDGDNRCITDGELENLPVVAGDTYYILVSSQDGQEADFTLNVEFIVPPDNDNACNSGDNDSESLGLGSFTGNTCCARGTDEQNTDGSAADIDPQECSGAAQNENVVWHYFTPGSEDGFDITFNGANMTVEAYWAAPDAGCSGSQFGELIGTGCTGSWEKSFGNCPPNEGDVIHFRVSSSDDNCGDYTLTVESNSCMNGGEECPEAIYIDALPTAECEDTSIGKIAEGCLTYACPDPGWPGCPEFADVPTVWFQTEIDENAFSVKANVNPNTDWDPRISIFQGDDCDNLTLLTNAQEGSCSSDNGSPTSFTGSVIYPADEPFMGGTIWVAVSYDPNTVTDSDDLGFNIEMTADRECIDCVDDALGICVEDAVTITIEERSTDRALDDTEFCPGEEVRLCINFQYDPSQSNVDWLQAIIPRFGEGWDMDSFDPSAADIDNNFNGDDPEWIEWDDAACGPTARLGFPLVRTYIDDNGELTFCHTGCESCPPDADPVEIDDVLPSGWYYITPTGACSGGCSPRNNWGLSNGFGVTTIDICLDLRVRDEFEDCENENRLNIDILPASDALTGCWTSSVPCIRDDVLLGPDGWEVECVELPPVIAEGDTEFCSGADVMIELTTEPGYDVNVIVRDNGDVDGEGDGEAPNGNISEDDTMPSGGGSNFTVNETLINESGSTQTVTYIYWSSSPDIVCPSPRDSIEITIYSEILIEDQEHNVCRGGTLDVVPEVVGGTGNYETYQWFDGNNTLYSTDPFLSIDADDDFVSQTFRLVVTDDFGCTGEGFVTVVVNELPVFTIAGPESICLDGNPDEPIDGFVYEINTEDANLLASYNFINWDVVPFDALTGGSVDFFGSGSTMTISEAGTTPGVYIITAEIEDENGCQNTAELEIEVIGPYEVTFFDVNLGCGETIADIGAIAAPVDGIYDDPENWVLLTCDGTVVAEHTESDADGDHTFEGIDLNDYAEPYCFRIFVRRGDVEGCGEGVAEITIDPPAEGTPIDASAADICEGEDGTITVANDGDYTSYTITNLSSSDTYSTIPLTVSGLVDTTSFEIRAEDADGCISETVVVINVNPNPDFSISGALSFCDESSTTLTATPDVAGTVYNYTWNGNVSGAGSGMTFMTTVAETVTLTAEANGCTDEVSVTTTIDDNITLTTQEPTICDGSDAVFTVDAGYTNVQWYTVDGSTETEIIAEAGNSSITVNAPGTYKVTFTDPTAGCDGEGLFIVTESVTPVVEVTELVEVCRNDIGTLPTVVNFMNEIQTGGTGGTWTQLPPTSGVDFSNVTNVDFDGIAAGMYSFAYTVSGDAPCGDGVDTLIVDVQNCTCPTIVINAQDPICDSESFDLNTSKSAGTADGNWVFVSSPDNDASVLVGNVFNPTNATLPAGDYTFRYDLDPVPPPNCTPSMELVITVEAAQIAEAMDAVICNQSGQSDPTSVDLMTLLSDNTTMSGTWTDSDSTPLTDTNIDGLSQTPVTLTYTYTTPGTETCPPVSTDVDVRIRNCQCPDLSLRDTTLCSAGEIIDLNSMTINESGIPGSWTWSGAIDPISGDQFDPMDLQTGTYTLTFTLDSEPNPGNGCDTEATAMWTIVRQPFAEAELGDAPCNVDNDPNDGENPTIVDLDDWLTDDSRSGGQWIQTGGPTIAIDGDNMVDFDGTVIGTDYMFRYILTAGTPCTDVEVDITITVSDCDCPPIDLVAPDDQCNDMGEITLSGLSTVSSDGTFTMTGPDGPVAISGDVVSTAGWTAGTYTVTFTLNDAPPGACTGSLSETFEVINYETTDITPQIEVCNTVETDNSHILDLNAQLSNPLSTGTWADTDGTGVSLADPNNVDFTQGSGGAVAEGTYTFTYTITNASPCGPFVTSIEVTVVDCACPPINPDNPEDICLTQTAVDLFPYNDPSRPGTWSTTETGVTITEGRYLDATVAGPGSYVLIYTVDSPDPGCNPDRQRTIMVFEELTAGTPNELSPREFCLGDSEVVQLSGMLDGQDPGGLWTNNTSSSSGTFDPIQGTFDITDAGVGLFTFTYSFDNESPCNDSEATVEIIIYGNPNADAGPDQMLDCDTPEVEIGGNSTPAGVGYKWKEVLNGIVLDPNDTPTIVADQAGTYELTVTDLSNAALCTDQDSTIVAIEDGVPTIELFVEQPQCFGDMGSITGSNPSGGSGNYTYSFNGGPFNSELSFNNLTPGQEYSFVIRNEDNGCEKEYTEVVDNVFEFEVALIDTIIVGNVNANFDLTFEVTTPSDVQTVKWTDDEGNVLCEGDLATCDTLSVTPTRNTVYFVELTNTNGCVTNDQLEIRLEEIVDVDFPNIIRPGSKNGNGSFYIQSDNVKNIRQLIIFDRWGEKVFDVQNIPPNDPNQGWDGTFRGKDVVPGVYTWLVELELQTSAGTPAGDMKETGDVTVIR